MKFTSKFSFIPILMILALNIFILSLNSCTTLDFIEEKISAFLDFPSKSSNSKTSKTVSFKYAVPKDFSKAYSFRTDLPDEISKKIPAEIKNLKTSNPASYVQKCCDFINANTTDSFQKVKIAHDIVALNTKYDAKSFWSGTIPLQNYENVLKTGLAVCEGYSNLLKKFLDTLGFQNVKVHGYARGVGFSLLNEKTVSSNHAWNLVKIEGEYYFIDSTWDSGYMNGKSSVQKYTTDYLFIKPEHFIYTHFPDNKTFQLLENPISNSEFLTLADFRPKFFEVAENFSIITENNFLVNQNSQISNENFVNSTSENSINKFIKKQTQTSSSIQTEYNLKNDCLLKFVVTQDETKSQKNNLTFTQTDETKTFTTIQFPSSGLYKIEIFYYKKNSRQGWNVAQFFVDAKSSSSILYPQIFSNSFEAKIISPIEMPLKKGETYHFEINCPERKFIALINGRNFIQMQMSENGNFTLDFEIPSNTKTLNIAASNSERASYQAIANYICE